MTDKDKQEQQAELDLSAVQQGEQQHSGQQTMEQPASSELRPNQAEPAATGQPSDVSATISVPNDEPSTTLAGLPQWLVPWACLLLSAIIIVLDLWTKQMATDALTLYRPVEINAWLNMTLAHNYGAAFSFLSQAGGWQRWFFTGLAGVVSVVLVIWLFRLQAKEKLTAIALAMILGGAIGNLVDRVNHGYVVDFIDVFYGSYHWPAFNLADSAITCGIVLLLVDGFFGSGRTIKDDTDKVQSP